MTARPAARTLRVAAVVVAAAGLGVVLPTLVERATEPSAGPSAEGSPGPSAEPCAGSPGTGRPLVIGHRGAAGTAPENTVAALEQARAAGADRLEADVQLSADGVPFLFHDDTPARTTDVEVVFPGREDDPVTSFTWAELRQLDAGAYFSGRFAGQRIPHLDDAARAATGGTGVHLEIKSPGSSPGVEQVVAAALTEDPLWTGLLEAGRITVLGFDEDSNRAFAGLAPEVPLQQLTGAVPDAATVGRWARFADSVGADHRVLDAGAAARVDAAGVDLGVYTVNSPEAVRDVLALGVDAVTGDFPLQIGRCLDGQDPYPADHGVQITGSVDAVPGDDVRPGAGEHVVLTNTGARTVDVGGWSVRSAAGSVLVVGEGYELAPGAQLRVHTGPGTATGTAWFAGRSTPVLDDRGDSVALWTDTGQLQDVFAG